MQSKFNQRTTQEIAIINIHMHQELPSTFIPTVMLGYRDFNQSISDKTRAKIYQVSFLVQLFNLESFSALTMMMIYSDLIGTFELKANRRTINSGLVGAKVTPLQLVRTKI